MNFLNLFRIFLLCIFFYDYVFFYTKGIFLSFNNNNNNFRNKPKAGLSTNSGVGHKVSKNHNAFLVT